MQHCSTVLLLVVKGKGLSTSFHTLTGKETIFTRVYTQSQYDPYTVTESKKKKKKIGWEQGAGEAKEASREEESSAPLCSSSTSTSDPVAVNLKVEVFLSPFLLSDTAHITDK